MSKIRTHILIHTVHFDDNGNDIVQLNSMLDFVVVLDSKGHCIGLETDAHDQ